MPAVPAPRVSVHVLNDSAHDIVKRIDRLSLSLTRMTPDEQSSPEVLFMIDQLAEWIIATARRSQMAARTPAGLALIALAAVEDDILTDDWSSA